MVRINTLSFSILFLSICLLVFQAKASDGIRCKNKLVSIGASKAEVLLKCGEPLLKETIAITEESRTRIESQAIPSIPAEDTTVDTIDKKAVIKTVDQWTYNFGRGTFLKMLIFKGGSLVEINSGPRVD